MNSDTSLQEEGPSKNQKPLNGDFARGGPGVADRHVEMSSGKPNPSHKEATAHSPAWPRGRRPRGVWEWQHGHEAVSPRPTGVCEKPTVR